MSVIDDIILHTGLDLEEFQVSAFAEPLEPGRGAATLPALVAGTYRGCNATIRAWPITFDPTSNQVARWDAVAYVSQHPALALDELGAAERERLRAETLTPTGLTEPVGQAAVAVPYAPPMPASGEVFDATAVELLPPETIPSCGGRDCVILEAVGGGLQEIHDPNTCPRSPEADRG